MDPGSDDQEFIRSDAEWKRWEQSDRHAWREAKRRQWAESLWHSQHQRRVDRVRLKKRLMQEEARREQEAEREHRRRKRWGHSGHHYSFRHHADVGTRVDRNRDPRGFYRALGLDVGRGEVTQAAIKKAFRQLALRWHPDQHADARRAKETFHLIKSAYDVLRDPKQRELYDRGELPRS
jgi:hypothetical protein